MKVDVRVFKCPAGVDHEAMKATLRAANPDSIVQSARVDAARNRKFVEMIAAQTFAALRTGQLLAERPEMDLLLRLSGTAQISQAIRDAGATKGDEFLLIVASDGKGVRSGGIDADEMEAGELTEDELRGIEAAALLSAEKA